jgi:heme exporter protein B
MSVWLSLMLRDLQLAFGRGGAILPLIFIILVATLFPFAIGPDASTLVRVGGGVIWVAALLGALLPMDRLIAPDLDTGMTDQIVVRGIPDSVYASAKLAAHWLSFGPIVMIAALPASALLKLPGAVLVQLQWGLLIGTPGLAALGLMGAALTAGLRGGGALAGLLVLPLAVPILIFGGGSLSGKGGGLYLLGGSSLLLVAIAPFVVAGALKGQRE